jgi:hypothetical protein
MIIINNITSNENRIFDVDFTIGSERHQTQIEFETTPRDQFNPVEAEYYQIIGNRPKLRSGLIRYIRKVNQRTKIYFPIVLSE